MLNFVGCSLSDGINIVDPATWPRFGAWHYSCGVALVSVQPGASLLIFVQQAGHNCVPTWIACGLIEKLDQRSLFHTHFALFHGDHLISHKWIHIINLFKACFISTLDKLLDNPSHSEVTLQAMDKIDHSLIMAKIQQRMSTCTFLGMYCI